MADPKSEERIVLKILAGAQVGAEVSLGPGEYLLGAGPEDDIQFIDVGMKPGHLRLRLAPGKIEIRNGAGSFSTAAGLKASTQGEEWQEAQPLDVIATGTTRFALGPPTAQWATIADQGDLGAAANSAKIIARPSSEGLVAKARALAIPISVFILFLAISLSLLIATNRGLPGGTPAAEDVAGLREALDQFFFGRSLQVKQDVDGAIYVSGYVETPVERRAIVGVIDKSGLSVALRLGVLQVFRTELDGLIKAEKVNVSYDLEANGVVILRGVILTQPAADQFVAEVAQNVIGLGRIESQIKTARDLFVEIQRLAHLSQIDDAVVFRLDGAVIEANGIISVNKIDQWVGFLQAYSRRFGAEIGLRSYVQLQSPDAAAQARAGDMVPILLGVVPPQKGVDLDLNRLKSGDFKYSEAFAGRARPIAGAQADKVPPPGAPLTPPNARFSGVGARQEEPPAANLRRGWTPGPAASGRTGPPQALGVARASLAPAPKFIVATRRQAAAPADPPGPDSARPALPATFRHDVGDMADRADSLVGQWLGGELAAKAAAEDGKDAALQNALDMLANENLGLASAPPPSLSEATKELFAHKYLPLFALSRMSTINAARQCRPGSRLSPDNLPAALFWLDVMSTTDAMTLRDFDLDAQGFILEAALNPELVTDCLRRDPATAGLIASSIYLAEAKRNPAFVRFVTQSLPTVSLDVTGVNLTDPRFIQLRDGSKLREGEAPDAGSRIDSIGELGLSVLLADGFAAVIYPSDIAWLAER
jgi:Inner membrane component of T3SS, cytoplasmic domain